MVSISMVAKPFTIESKLDGLIGLIKLLKNLIKRDLFFTRGKPDFKLFEWKPLVCLKAKELRVLE